MARKPGIPKLKKDKQQSTKPVKQKRASIFGGKKSGSEDFLLADNEKIEEAEVISNNGFFAEDIKTKMTGASKAKARKSKVPRNKRNNSFFAEDDAQSDNHAAAVPDESEPKAKLPRKKRKNSFFEEGAAQSVIAQAAAEKPTKEEKHEPVQDEADAAPAKPSREEKRKAREEKKAQRLAAHEPAQAEDIAEHKADAGMQEPEGVVQSSKAENVVQDEAEAATEKPSRDEKRKARKEKKQAAILAAELAQAEDDAQETADAGVQEPEGVDAPDVKEKGKLRGFFFAGHKDDYFETEDARKSAAKSSKTGKGNEFLDETGQSENKRKLDSTERESSEAQTGALKQDKQIKIIKLGDRKSRKKNEFAIKTIDDKDAFEKKQSKKAKRIGRRESNFFATVIARIKSILPGSKNKAQALDYAQSDKKSSGKRNNWRRIAVFATAGALVIAIVIVVIFVPFGKAADETPDGQSAAVAVAEASASSAPSTDVATPSVQPSQPTVTQTAIVTTPPDQSHRTFNIDSMVLDSMVEASLYYNKVGYSNNYYKHTENEIYMLAQLIHGEARGESLNGKVAVGNVVLNRVLNRSYFGNTMKAVVTASHQFSGYNPNTIPGSASKYAARLVLDRQVWLVPQNVYYFKSSGMHGVDWGSHKFYVQIGGHSFYTHRYRGRSNTDKIPPRMFERTFKWPRMGCKPEDRVYRVQFMLNQLGYDVIADSYFGEGTKDELKKFQEKKGLDADGVAGPSTIEALIRAYGIENYFDKFYT